MTYLLPYMHKTRSSVSLLKLLALLFLTFPCFELSHHSSYIDYVISLVTDILGQLQLTNHLFFSSHIVKISCKNVGNAYFRL